jgi:hypothetical protein
MRRLLVLAIALGLAPCAPVFAQAPPRELWESGPAAGDARAEHGRSAVLFGLALVAFAGAGGLAVLAVRAPRRPREPAAQPPRDRRLLPEPERHPRVSGGPPPLPAFGPGSHAGPSAAPPPPD